MSDTPFRALTDGSLESATVALADEAATAALARRLADSLAPGMVIWLSGALGVGKTTLVRSLLAALGHTGRVASPTFTLLEPYELSSFPVYHFDFYRFSAANEWRDAGFDEYFAGNGVCLVEWPETCLVPICRSVSTSLPTHETPAPTSTPSRPAVPACLPSARRVGDV